MNHLFYQCRKGTKSQRHKAAISCFLLLASFLSSAQQKEQDTTKINQLDDVLVTAVRATSKTPVSFSNLSKKEIASRNLGQDIPILMNFLPSVVTTSDAGNGVGYTGIRVRGSDATRVNVTINGIPYNDSESHGTFWVNMPDFASSTESLQLQRGVGTSTNGAGAFGASLNVLTDSYSEKASGEISNSFGSFNTRKHTVKFSTGLLNDHFEIAGRLSNIDSHGYIDRAFSELHSYFLQGTYVGKSTLIKALVFGGKERTYQSWNGIDAATLESDRTFNPSGMYTDANGDVRFYDNETDNYRQDHYQLHLNQNFSENWNLNFALHYTKGKGYYENYKEDAAFEDYGLLPVGAETATDLIAQKWLDNDFYGYTFSLNYKNDKLDLLIGGGGNKYNGAHFGKVIWARFASQSEPGDHYYDDCADKTDNNAFTKVNYQLTEKLNLFGDVQFRNVGYRADGAQATVVDDNFNFFNPKAGLNYTLDGKSTFYFSYAIANREPNRTDYEGGSVKPEKLGDFELGWRFSASKFRLNINGYYMRYKDQLVLTGALDDVGNPIRTNVGKSYRAGIEAEAVVKILKKFTWRSNMTISSNKNQDFVIDNGSGLVNLGDTNIAFSPNIIVGNMLVFQPAESLSLALMTKFVDQQYMSNIDDENSKLDAYTQTDFSISYELKTKKIFKSIIFTGLLNNVFDEKYVSNGADYGGGYIYYFPQAGINFLAGMTLKF
ncbi:TonB-dependent receptor [Flavobacterium sp. 3HN19-14]|uniref:TonB-dependent receptor n=1 Tax=Flavobacterium sp. 3HN19-14 TaxID=3448133 RepID=UPI003EE23F0B